MKSRQEKLLNKALKIKDALDSLEADRRLLWKSYSDALDALMESGFVSAKKRGFTAYIIDNFENQNIQFRTTSFRRFDLGKRRS